MQSVNLLAKSVHIKENCTYNSHDKCAAIYDLNL